MTEEEYDPNRYAYLYAPHLCPECQEPVFDGCDCVDVDWTADSERRKKEYEDRLKQKRDGERRQEDEQQKEMNDGGMQQEKQQQQGKGEERQSLEELIRTVKFRMQQEEKQEQMNGEDEARRESETYRKKRGSEQEIKWEIGKGKGTERGKATASGEERRVGGTTRQEGKGRGEVGIRKFWEDWWRVREAEWMNEEWREWSGDDLDVGENGVGLRREQWEEVRNSKMRSESIYKVEKVGEEMENEIKQACKRMSERWESPTEESDRSGFESLQKKVERLGRRVEELEGERKKGRDSRRVTESSSGSEGGGGKWRWDGEDWWFKVNLVRRKATASGEDDWGDHRRDKETERRAV